MIVLDAHNNYTLTLMFVYCSDLPSIISLHLLRKELKHLEVLDLAILILIFITNSTFSHAALPQNIMQIPRQSEMEEVCRGGWGSQSNQNTCHNMEI